MKDLYEEQYSIHDDDGSWLTIPNGHDVPLNMDLSKENAPSPACNSMDIDDALGDATSNFLDVASSIGVPQQAEESSSKALAGTKHELEDLGEEPSRPKTRRRKGEPEPDYSAMSRQKIKQNKRTGQACDRCKLRKLRCDQEPNGCMPCADIKHPCQVTDRVTGETFLRGEAGQLKAQNESLKAKVVELEEKIDQLHSENQNLHAQLFCYEMTQSGSPRVTTGETSHASDVATPHDAALKSITDSPMPDSPFPELD